MKITNQKQIRKAFWENHPHLEAYALMWGIKTAPHNRHNAETRTAFSYFIDELNRAGIISDSLAIRSTL